MNLCCESCNRCGRKDARRLRRKTSPYRKNVWLGGDVKILAGVTIGDNSIVGIGSIVTKDIPENVIAAGNPCRILRNITDTDKTDFLKRG